MMRNLVTEKAAVGGSSWTLLLHGRLGALKRARWRSTRAFVRNLTRGVIVRRRPSQPITSFTTVPNTSVNRKSRPA